MTETKTICRKALLAEEHHAKLPCQLSTQSLPRHKQRDPKALGNQFKYSQLGRAVIKQHTYLTPVTYPTYPWNYQHPTGRSNQFRMPRTVYPRK